jgi:hypothetical protein
MVINLDSFWWAEATFYDLRAIIRRAPYSKAAIQARREQFRRAANLQVLIDKLSVPPSNWTPPRDCLNTCLCS